MKVKSIYDYEHDELVELKDDTTLKDENVLLFAVLASEKDPFDAMEKAIWEASHRYIHDKLIVQLKMIYEYPLQGRPPMMTHVYKDGNTKIVAAKGAAERIIEVCHLNEADKNKISQHVKSLASKGYRVIGVASAAHTDSVYRFPRMILNGGLKDYWHYMIRRNKYC